MPLYDYKCTQCEHHYEQREGFDAPNRQPCPKCGGMAKRLLHPPPIVFKGSGFYITDSRKMSHGLKANLSGRWFTPHHYGVDRESEVIDYDTLEKTAREVRPALLIAGGSAYPRALDFERMGHIAKKVGAWFHADIAHIAGLVAAGVHPSPFPHADIVTCTTTKTLRGPRGGLVLTNNGDWMKRLQSAVFPGVQGSIHTQVIAAKAVCLGEALTDEFRAYASQVKANAATLAETLANRGVRIVSGGTDTHLVLLDVSSQGLTGKQAELALEKANLTSNKNAIPYDSPRPPEWVGLRLGASAATTRGLKEAEFESLGEMIADLLQAERQGDTGPVVKRCAGKVAALCERFPVYGE